MSKKLNAPPQYRYSIEEISAACISLAQEGLIVDTGRRTRSERTGRYNIVWVAADCGKKP
jgi:hypothetical protein